MLTHIDFPTEEIPNKLYKGTHGLLLAFHIPPQQMKDVKARFHRFSHPDLMEKVKLLSGSL